MNDNGRKIESLLLLLARVVSALFNPLWFVIVLFVLMFTMTYLAVLPLFYKMYVLAVVLFFTVLLPLTAPNRAMIDLRGLTLRLRAIRFT